MKEKIIEEIAEDLFCIEWEDENPPAKYQVGMSWEELEERLKNHYRSRAKSIYFNIEPLINAEVEKVVKSDRDTSTRSLFI